MPIKTLVSTPIHDAAALPSLAADGLACRRGNRLLFKGLNLSVGAGRALWLRGRNGSGKTSLLRLAAGLSVPADGQITWGGVPVRRHEGYARQMLYVGHANALKDDLSTTESLRFLAVMHGRRADEASLQQALAKVGMASRQDALVRTLSQGQRRRASLARLALETEAALWILDEPYDALDVDGVAIVDALLHEHLARGGSLLFTSHQSPGDAAPSMAQIDLGAYA